MRYTRGSAAAMILRLAPPGIVRALGQREGVDFLLRHHQSLGGNDPLVTRLLLEDGDRNAACRLAEHVWPGGEYKSYQDQELAARLLALDDPEVNAALFEWGGRWTRWAVVKQFRYGDGVGPVPLAPTLRARFLEARRDLVFALEAADDEVAEQALAWIGRGISAAQRARALRRSPSAPPWPRDDMTALVRRVVDARAEAMTAFEEASTKADSLSSMYWAPH